jgi:signal transduction histidine kinase
VRQILAFSRKPELLKQKIDLREIVEEALQMMRAGLPATIRLVENLAAVPPILGDPGQLHQVIVNLIANAAQAMSGRPGMITVGLSPHAPVSAGAPAMIGLTVKDTGCGIDQAYLTRIFEPFFTTRMVGEGTGLGLSVVHGIITGHGGTINVRSKPGEGAEFSITLPVIEASTEPRSVDRTAA